MTVKEKLNILEEMLLIDKDTLDETAELDDINGWDSMAVISVIAMLDSLFNKSIKSEEVKKFKTVKDIMDQME